MQIPGSALDAPSLLCCSCSRYGARCIVVKSEEIQITGYCLLKILSGYCQIIQHCLLQILFKSAEI